MPKVNFDYIGSNEQLSPAKVNANFQTLENMINSGELSGGGGGGTVTGSEYGVEWDITNKRFTRLNNALGLSATLGSNGIVSSDFDNVYPWSEMRRCNLSDDGVVTAYYGDSNFSETGSNGQVMVEIPKFYYKTIPVAYTVSNGDVVPTKVQFYISNAKLDGYSLHPAFIRDNVILDYIYLGAYEASVYDVSAARYVADFGFDGANDILGSVKGLKPVSGKTSTFTRATARNMARRRGAGWEQQDFLSTSAVQLMMLIEFASFDSQTDIGAGVSNKTDDGSNNMAENTGYTSGLGNKSGNAATSSSSYRAVTYRGIENLWGNIWVWIDGINIQNNKLGYPWIADHGFADDIMTEPYHRINGKIPASNGYIDKLIYDGSNDFAMLPSSAGGASNTPVNSYMWQNVASTSMTVARLGGGWNDGSYCGGWCWSLSTASSNSSRNIGARLGFYKKTTHAQAA